MEWEGLVLSDSRIAKWIEGWNKNTEPQNLGEKIEIHICWFHIFDESDATDGGPRM